MTRITHIQWVPSRDGTMERVKCLVVEPGVYEIRWGRILLGHVRRNECSDGWWSEGRWSIDGLPAPFVVLGVSGATKRKRLGFRRLADAARYVAVMASGRIISEVCREGAQP